MSMKCDMCQVAMNSSQQFQQHLDGQAHAKRLRLLNQQQEDYQPEGQWNRPQVQGQGDWYGSQLQSPRYQQHQVSQLQSPRYQPQSQGRGWGHGQNPVAMQGPGQGRGRAIRGVGGRGWGSDQGGGGGMQGQGMLPFGHAQLPGLEPLVMNALNITATALQSGNMPSFGRGGQPIAGTGRELFDPEDEIYFGQDSRPQQTFGRGPPFGRGQGMGNNPFLGGQSFASNPRFGNTNNEPFCNDPFPGNERFVNPPPFPGNQHRFANPPPFPGNRGQNWKAKKPQRPKQPPPPKAKKLQPDLAEPLVFGDNMGVVSVSMEGENQLYCDVCCVNMTSADQAVSHYRGAKHIKKARIARLREVGGLDDEDLDASVGGVYCSYCNVTVNSQEQMEVHEQGNKHKKMVEQRKRKMVDAMDTEPYGKRPSFSRN